MADTLCKPLANLGSSDCGFDLKAMRRVVLVPLFATNGDENKFANTAAVTKAAIQALCDAALPLDRIYPMPQIGKEIAIEQADDAVKEYTDGSTAFLSEGKETISFRLPSSHPLLKNGLQSFRNQQLGYYYFDKAANMAYQTDSATGLEVLPIPIDGNSIRTKFVKAVEEDESYVEFSFQSDDAALGELFRFIPKSSLDFNGLGSDIYPLRDVEVVYTGISTTGFTAELKTIFGEPVTGLDTNPTTGDLTDLYNNDTTSAIVPTGITETPAASGIYVFAMTAQTIANILTLTPTRSKFDFTKVVAVDIVIPS